MRILRAVLVGAAVAVAAQAQEPGTGADERPSPPRAIAALPAGADDCLARLEARAAALADAADAAEADYAPPSLGDVCPEVAQRVGAGPWGAALVDLPPADLGAKPFAELIDTAGHYLRRTAAEGRDLAPARLADIARRLEPFEPLPQLSMWDRLMQWLQDRLGLEPQGAGDGFLEWLRGFSLPERWIRVVFFSLGTLIVLAALAVLANELRHAGVFARGRAASRGDAAAGAAEPSSFVVRTLEELRRSPPRRQPALLLAMIVERLRARDAAAMRDSATHRELIAAAGVLPAPQQASFETVAAAAERVSFAGWAPTAVDIQPVVSVGEALLGDLDAAADARRPS